MDGKARTRDTVLVKSREITSTVETDRDIVQYTKITRVSVSSSKLAPPAPSPLSECYSPTWKQRGEGNTRLRVRGWGEPIRTTGEKDYNSVYSLGRTQHSCGGRGEKGHTTTENKIHWPRCFRVLKAGGGVTKRCRLSWMTNSDLVHIWAQMQGEGGSCGVSAIEYSHKIIKRKNGK